MADINLRYATHPYYRYFLSMIQRARRLGIACKYKLCLESFNEFLGDTGQIPEGMKIPTVGRYDHKKGYVFDVENNRLNFRWEPKSDNSKELAGRVLTPEVRSKAGKSGGRRTAELGKAGLQTATSEQRSKWNRERAELGKLGFQTATSEQQSERGRKSTDLKKGIHAATSEQRSKWASENNYNVKQIHTCKCGFTGTGPVMSRWHGDNCRKKCEAIL